MLTPPEPARFPPAGPARNAGFFAARVRVPGGLELSYLQLALIAAVVFYALAMPGDLRFKLDSLGFGVCHQIASHSFYIGGHQLPLCARCSGIYLGAFASFVLLVARRGKAVGMPARHMLVILAVFFGAMAVDGINSTLQALGSPIWDTTNLLRLFTGSLAGIAVVFFFYPLFNMSLWRPDTTRGESVLQKPVQLLGYMLGVAVLVGLVLLGEEWLFYPLAVASIVGMLILLTMANTMIILTVTRREATFASFSEALTPLLIGLLISLVELTLLAWGRESLAPYLANNIGMPLFPGLP